jgi:hypothetical protein
MKQSKKARTYICPVCLNEYDTESAPIICESIEHSRDTENAELEAKLAEANDKIAQHFRSFEGHVYIKNEEYAALCLEVSGLKSQLKEFLSPDNNGRGIVLSEYTEDMHNIRKVLRELWEATDGVADCGTQYTGFWVSTELVNARSKAAEILGIKLA